MPFVSSLRLLYAAAFYLDTIETTQALFKALSILPILSENYWTSSMLFSPFLKKAILMIMLFARVFLSILSVKKLTGDVTTPSKSSFLLCLSTLMVFTIPCVLVLP